MIKEKSAAAEPVRAYRYQACMPITVIVTSHMQETDSLHQFLRPLATDGCCGGFR